MSCHKPAIVMMLSLLIHTSTFSAGKTPFQASGAEWKWITPEANLKEAKAALIPYPTKAMWKEGVLTLDKLIVSVTSKEQTQTARSAMERLAEAAQVPYSAISKKGNVTLILSSAKNSTSKEAYQLLVSETGVKITASDAAGLFYGVQTLRQLISSKNGTLQIPYCQITDAPAFEIRGFMHDVGRNFISVDALKEQLEIMALYKINIFHFHLTDGPAFRVESKKYPQLNEAKNMSRWEGKFYTTEELKDLVAFCKERHITIIPELDMPGHSGYFNKAMGFDMQTDEGVEVLKDLVDEWVEIFDGPWFHLGMDEVRLKNKDFVEVMTKYTRSKGKTVIVWYHGAKPIDKETIQQPWNAGRSPNTMIDSKGYINTDDPILSPRNYFLRQYCYVEKGDADNLGGILCYWPDQPVANEDVEMRIGAVYPSIAAFAERIWQGNPNVWNQTGGAPSFHGAPPVGSGAHRAYAEFESRLASQREKFFAFRPEHFPFVKNADIVWNVIGPFPNDGDIEAVFGPEKEIEKSYTVNGEIDDWKTCWGGTVSLGDLYTLPKSKKVSHTAYALTYVHSDRNQTVFAWINFSRRKLNAGNKENPAQGDWPEKGGRLWINGKIVSPPTWGKPDHYTAPITEESYIYRKPQKIALKKGWNTVLFKTTNEHSMWTVSFLPVEWDGKGFSEVPGLNYSVQPK